MPLPSHAHTLQGCYNFSQKLRGQQQLVLCALGSSFPDHVSNISWVLCLLAKVLGPGESRVGICEQGFWVPSSSPARSYQEPGQLSHSEAQCRHYGFSAPEAGFAFWAFLDKVLNISELQFPLQEKKEFYSDCSTTRDLTHRSILQNGVTMSREVW